MRVLVDTSIWSLSLRRRSKGLAPKESILRDETGIRNDAQYGRLRDILRWFSDEPLAASDYELAAKLSNQCRAAAAMESSRLSSESFRSGCTGLEA